eukprot:gene10879-3583_t
MSTTYTDSSEPQLKALEQNFIFINKYIPSYLFEKNKKQLFIADYGSSEGKNATILMKHVISLIKTAKKESKVHIYFTDRESNQWQTLFSLINQKDEILNFENNVLCSCIGKSFYSQIFPENSIDFAFSGNSFHWASENYNKVTTNKGLAKQDWENILRNRSMELKPGGILIVNFVAFDENLKPPFYLQILKKVMKEMVKQNKLKTEEIQSFYLPVHRRKEEDILDQEIFQKYQLQLLDSKVDYFPNPMFDEYHLHLKNGMEINKAASIYAKKVIAWNRGYGEFFYELMLKNRKNEEKEILLIELFDRVHDEIVKNVDQCQVNGHQIYLAIRKIQNISKL